MEPSCLTNFYQSEYEADFSIFLSLHQPHNDFGDKNLVVILENDLNIPVMSLIWVLIVLVIRCLHVHGEIWTLISLHA